MEQHIHLSLSSTLYNKPVSTTSSCVLVMEEPGKSTLGVGQWNFLQNITPCCLPHFIDNIARCNSPTQWCQKKRITNGSQPWGQHWPAILESFMESEWCLCHLINTHLFLGFPLPGLWRPHFKVPRKQWFFHTFEYYILFLPSLICFIKCLIPDNDFNEWMTPTVTPLMRSCSS